MTTSSKLRATAVPFVPTSAVTFESNKQLHCNEPTWSIQQQQQQQQEQEDDQMYWQQVRQAEQQASVWEHDYTEHDYGYTWDGLNDCSASEAMHAPVGDDFWAYAQQQESWQQAWPDMASSWQLEQDILLPADESLHLLACWYPEQPKLLLEQVLEACEGNLQQASQVVWDIEWERRQARGPASLGPSNIGRAASTRSRSSTTAAAQQQQAFQLRQEAFPALPSAGNAAAGLGSNTAAFSATPDDQRAGTVISGVAGMSLMSPNTAAAAAEGDDPWISSSTGPPGSGSSSNCTWAKIAGKVPAKPPALAAASSAGGDLSQGDKVNPQHLKQAAATAAAAAGTRASSAAGATAVPWVATGEAVSKEYQVARAEARDFARVRNTCFQQATLAYLAGNKALAKELSMKGRQAAEQMWTAHEQASQQIFSQRNAPLVSPAAAVASSQGASSNSRVHQVMDLHGLHVREALMMLRQRLQQLAAQQSCNSISLIVGTGHHTKGAPAAKLGPAVEQLLQELGLSYKEPQPGLLRVQLH